MKTSIFICLLIFGFSSVSAQFQNGGLIPNRGIRESQVPLEVLKKEREEMMKDKRETFLAEFLKTLEADNFQMEIIKQTLNDYFDKQPKLYERKYASTAEFQDTIDKFNKAHFAELKQLISEADMEKINLMIDGKYEPEDSKKKKKRKKLKKKKDDN